MTPIYRYRSFLCLIFFDFRGANPIDTSPRKCTPLFYACSAGRPDNADFILKKCKTGMHVVSHTIIVHVLLSPAAWWDV